MYFLSKGDTGCAERRHSKLAPRGIVCSIYSDDAGNHTWTHIESMSGENVHLEQETTRTRSDITHTHTYRSGGVRRCGLIRKATGELFSLCSKA